jgi:hypothetical protein
VKGREVRKVDGGDHGRGSSLSLSSNGNGVAGTSAPQHLSPGILNPSRAAVPETRVDSRAEPQHQVAARRHTGGMPTG